MKSLFIFTFMAIIGFAWPTDASADAYNDGWTCYSSNNYRGSKKSLRAGEYTNVNNWRYYSWKTNCCVKFYFYYRDGKKGEKVLCGDVRDFKNEMRKWGNLKHGYQGGWKNIYRAVFYCENGGHQANNGNNNGNQGNYNDYLRRGHCVAWRGSNYAQEFVSYQPGKKYYPRDLKFKFASWRLPKDHFIIFFYKNRSGQTKEYESRSNVSNFKSHYSKWDIRNRNNPWEYIQHFEVRKGGGGNGQANNGNQGNYNDYLRRGHCVAWRGSNYAQEFVSYQPGKKYYPRDLKFKFASWRLPKDHFIIFFYKNRSGQTKEYESRSNVSNFKSHYSKWDIRNRNNPWEYIQHFEVRKGGGGNGQANNGNQGNYNDYLRRGHCVAWRGSNYAQEFVSYQPGKKYYPRDLKFKFASWRLPKDHFIIFFYKNRSGQTKEYESRSNVSNFKSHYSKWDIRNRNNPWEYIQHFEVRKVGQGGGNNNYGGKEDYKKQAWYEKYRRGGYIVFTQYKYFAGRYAAKPNGDYDNRRLGFYVQSIYIPSSSRYVVMEYYDRNKRKKSATIKQSIHDLAQYLRDLGVHRDYEREPYKAVTRLAVIRQ